MADVNKIVDGTSAVYQAVTKNHGSIVRSLADNPSKNNADLNLKADENCVECTRAGDAPLHEAVVKGYTTIIETLINNKADVNIQNSIHKNSQPIHEAGVHARTGALELLKTGGADINAKDTDNNTPMIHASIGGHQSTVSKTADLGAEVNLRNNLGKTASRSTYSADITTFLSGIGGTSTGKCPCADGTPFDQVACPVNQADYCASCDDGMECASCDSFSLQGGFAEISD